MAILPRPGVPLGWKGRPIRGLPCGGWPTIAISWQLWGFRDYTCPVPRGLYRFLYPHSLHFITSTGYRKGILTPLYWSPDGRFVFFVRQGPTWRLPPRCSLEDERDVTVHDLAQGGEDIVSTVCGGFPYGGLRWYKLMVDSGTVDLNNGNLHVQVPVVAATKPKP